MGLIAEGLRLLAMASSVGDGLLERDAYLPDRGLPSAPDTARLLSRLMRLTGLKRDPSETHDGLAKAAGLMAELFAEVGLAVERDAFSAEGFQAENVIGRLAGRSAIEPVIVMAHYDAVPGTPGADDNGSGAIGLVEIAERLARRSGGFARPIHFLATSLEESGMIGGAHHAWRARSEGVHAVIDLEMIGFTSETQAYPQGITGRTIGDFLAVVANEPSADLGRAFLSVARRVQADLPLELLVLRGKGDDLAISRLSDHAPFWDLDLPAVMLTDTAFLRNPNYHAPSDTLATLDLDFLSRVADLVAAVVAEIAG